MISLEIKLRGWFRMKAIKPLNIFWLLTNFTHLSWKYQGYAATFRWRICGNTGRNTWCRRREKKHSRLITCNQVVSNNSSKIFIRCIVAWLSVVHHFWQGIGTETSSSSRVNRRFSPRSKRFLSSRDEVDHAFGQCGHWRSQKSSHRCRSLWEV